MSTSAPIRVRPVAPPPSHRGRWIAGAAAVVVALAAGEFALLHANLGGTHHPVPSALGPGSSPGASAQASAAPSGAGPGEPTTRPSSASGAPPSSTAAGAASGATPSGGSPAGFRFLPLWPFGSATEAAQWQASTTAGQQPWRRDAGLTARHFAQDYLGYAALDRTTKVTISGDQAWADVGSTAGTAARVHLARIGTGDLTARPWEVVGTDDTTLTLTAPHYGVTVTGNRLTVGGRITGVDESLSVQVRGPDGTLLGSVSGVPAGGENTPWSLTVTVDDRVARLVTVAVATGGGQATVQSFAITGVRISPGGETTYPDADAALSSTVDHGTYLGNCPADGTAPDGASTVDDPVCADLLRSVNGRTLYQVRTWTTRSGYYVILARTGTQRWVVVDDNLAGPDVPPEFGGPMR